MEIIYPTCFIDAGGWISPNAANNPLQVSFGPTTAELVPDAATNAGLHDAQVVRWFYAPLELTAGGQPLWSGVIKVDPTNSNRAWLANQTPPGTVTRVQAAGLTNNRA